MQRVSVGGLAAGGGALPLRFWTLRSGQGRSRLAPVLWPQGGRSGFATDAAAAAAGRRRASARTRRQRREEEAEAAAARRRSNDPWGDLEINEIRIVYDPRGSAAFEASEAAPRGLAAASSASSEHAYDAPHAQRTSPDSAYERVSTADRFRSSGGSAGSRDTYVPPAPSSSSSSSASATSTSTASTTTAMGSGRDVFEGSSAATGTTTTGKPWSWRTKLFFVVVMLTQIWDIRRTVNKSKEAKQKKEDEQRDKLSSVTPADPTKQPQQQEEKQEQQEAPKATPLSAPSTSTSTVRKANSLQLWVSQQKKSKRRLMIQNKLTRGLNKHERDVVLELCIQSMIEAQQAREILAADATKQNFVDDDNEAAIATNRRGEVSVRKVLAEKLGAEVQLRDYTVLKTTPKTDTIETREWIQESRQFLQSRADPSRRVQMDIRTRIVVMKDEHPSAEAEEGLILVENGPELLQEMLQLIARPSHDQQSDSRVATYIEKVDMTFGPSMCLEFEFDQVRIS